MRSGQILNWLWLTIALIAVGAVQIVGSTGHTALPPLDPGSAQPNGSLALALWLRHVGYRVQTVTSPTISSAWWQSRDTLMLLAPQVDPAPTARRSLAGWVRRGGRLVLLVDSAATPRLLSTFGFSVERAPRAPIHVVQPLLVAPQVDRLAGRASAVLSSGAGGIAVAGTDYGSVVILDHVGRGLVWVVSSPGLLANDQIGRAGNRALALNLAGPPGSRVDLAVITPPVSSQPASSNWLTDTAWGVAVLFGIVVALLYRGLAGRRLGPAIEPPATTFRPAVEYALSIAGLLRRGRKRTQALLPYQRSLRRLLEQRGIQVVPAHMEALLETRDNVTERELIARAAAIVGYEEELERPHG